MGAGLLALVSSPLLSCFSSVSALLARWVGAFVAVLSGRCPAWLPCGKVRHLVTSVAYGLQPAVFYLEPETLNNFSAVMSV